MIWPDATVARCSFLSGGEGRACLANCTRALPARGRNEAIARSWIRSAIQGSVIGGIREGLGDAEFTRKGATQVQTGWAWVCT